MKYFAYLPAFCMCMMSYAQDLQFTFQEAVKTALENNVQLKQQENQQLVTQAQKLESWGQMGPRANARAQAWRTTGNQFIEQEARVVNDAQTNNFFGTVDANIVIFNGFRLQNSLKQADLQLESQSQSVRRTKQDVISFVSSQFLQILLDEEVLRIRQANLETQQRQLELIEEEVNTGRRATVDRFNQISQVKNAEFAKVQAEIALRNSKAALAQTMLIDPTLSYEVVPPDWEVEKILVEDIELKQLTATATTSRGDYLQAQLDERAAKRGVAIAKAAFIPTLGAFGSINSRYSNASTNSFGDQLDNNLRRQYGATLNIPIFTGFQNRTAYVQAKVNYENAKLTSENLKLTIKSEVLRANQNLKDAITNYNAAQASLEAAEVSFELETERYNLGIVDFVQLAQANANFVQAQTDFASATYRVLFNKLLLDYSIGTLNFEDLP